MNAAAVMVSMNAVSRVIDCLGCCQDGRGNGYGPPAMHRQVQWRREARGYRRQMLSRHRQCLRRV